MPGSFATLACSSASPTGDGAGAGNPAVDPGSGGPSGSDSTPADTGGTLDGQEPIAGGQSGGQTSAQGSAPFPCACLEQRPTVRATVVSAAGGCVELEVLETYGVGLDVSVGEVIGGVASPLCGAVYFAEPEFAEGDEVIAVYSRGSQDSSECAEYRACSLERCGPFPQEQPVEPDPDCVAEQQAGSPIDCRPSDGEPPDEAALLAWDTCDGQCVLDTREECAAHATDALLGGRVWMAKLQDAQLQYEWAGEMRSVPLAESFAADCSETLYEQFRDHYDRVMAETANGDAQATAPPPEPSPEPVCPLPR